MPPPVIRKSDIGAPPARMSAGAPPCLPVRRNIRGEGNTIFFAQNGSYRNGRGVLSSGARKRRFEENLDLEESDTDQTSTADDQDDNESADEIKKEEEEKLKRAPRKKRRFRLTDSTTKSKRRAERRAQLAAEKKEREEKKTEEKVEEEKERTATPQPAPKTPAVVTYSPFQLFCDHLLRKLQAKDTDEYFVYPVTQSMAPDYHKVIKEPMDFVTMRQKIESGAYSDLSMLKRDAELIISNAVAYNPSGTVYHVAAQKLDLIVQFYFSEQHLRYLYHTLPFTKEISLEEIGLTPKVRLRPIPKTNPKAAIVDNITPSNILESVDQSLKGKLSNRMPVLKERTDLENSNTDEPKKSLAFLDSKDGTVCLNIINPNSSQKRTLTLGDIVGKLEEGTPGLCAPVVQSWDKQVPISYLHYGLFSSFAPQIDSTWATLCERDSRLLQSTYGSRQNATNALTLRKMVEDSGEHLIKLVDDLLDTLTDGEHRRTIEALETEPSDVRAPAVEDDLSMNKLLDEIQSLENIGIDVSFISDVRKIYELDSSASSLQKKLDKTGAMISDLALLQKNRLSSEPPTTLTDQPAPSQLELNLASKVQTQLQTHISQYAEPGDVISPPVIHNAVGLNAEDLDLLNEFFTVPTTAQATAVSTAL